MKTIEKFAKKEKGGIAHILGAIQVDSDGVALWNNLDMEVMQNAGDLAPGVYIPDGLTVAPRMSDMESVDLPAMREKKASGEIKQNFINAADLLADLEYIQPAISKETARFYLNGICFQPGFMVATDGHKLCLVENQKLFAGYPEGGIIVPRQAIDVLVSLLKEHKKETDSVIVTYFDETDSIMFDLQNGSSVHTRLINATFPDWKRVFPQPDSMTVNRVMPSKKEMAEHLKMARLYKKQFNTGVSLAIKIEDGVARFAAPGGAEMFNGFKTDMPPVGVNLQLLVGLHDMTMLSNVDNLGPIQFEKDNRKALVMPMRV